MLQDMGDKRSVTKPKHESCGQKSENNERQYVRNVWWAEQSAYNPLRISNHKTLT